MNKQHYRLIFNKLRGILMAVAEHITSSGKSTQETRASSSRTIRTSAATGASQRSVAITLKPSHFAVLCRLGMVSLVGLNSLAVSTYTTLAHADVVVDHTAPANQQPVLLSAPNGVPLVNIQTPSAAGVSRNTYSQFDVNANGVILNNSNNNVQTQLGGFVAGNPYMAAGTARVILNEVNSQNPSLLNGYVEVAGSSAQVVIANPAGISCNGCGFINANRATLTTGAPMLSGGDLIGYRVTGGVVNILGSGLDSSQTNYTDIIARAVNVNAGIFAQNLNVTTGSNQVNVNTSQNTSDNYVSSVTPIMPTNTPANPTPSIAIDVAALGGMYAGKIHLIGTEAGVGVRNAGNMGASAGEISIDVNGNLTNTATGHINSQQNTQIQASSGISNAGTLYASGNNTLTTQGNLDNTGTIAALGNTSLNANGASSNINSSANSLLAAGLNVDGTLGSSGNLTISATQSITALGQNIAAQDQTLTAQSLDLSGSQNFGRNLSYTASTVTLDHASTIAKQISITSATLSNQHGEIIQTGTGATSIQASTSLDNTSGVIASNGNTTFTVGNLINQSGTIQAAGTADLTINATGNMLNTSGQITAAHDLSINANTLAGDGIIIGGRDVSLSLQGNYTQSAANQITANRDLHMTLTGDLSNLGTLQAVNNLDLNAANISNQGTLGAGATLAATATLISNTSVIVGSDVTLTASQKIENIGPNALIGATNLAGKLTLLAPLIENRDDTTATDTPATTTIYGLGQVILAGGQDNLGQYTSATHVLNQSGIIESGGDMLVVAGTLANTRRILQTNNTYTPTGQIVGGTVVWTPSNPDVPGGRYVEPPHAGLYNSDYLYTDYTGSYARNSITQISPKSVIEAGGSLTPVVTQLQNYWSTVAAVGNIPLTGVTLDQDGWSNGNSLHPGVAISPYAQSISYSGSYQYRNYDGSIYWGIAFGPTSPVVTPITGYDSSFTSAGTISGTGTTINNAAGSSAGTPLGIPATTASGTISTTGNPNTTLPNNGLFHSNPNSTANYLIATDPRFTDYRTWLSSDYMLGALAYDPATMTKRLGDGFYEQKLVREQIAQLTGRRFLTGYSNDEAEYQALMMSGVTVAKQFNLTPGVALSAAQMAQLTSDLVWLVQKDITLADGSHTQALVPQVYLHTQDLALTNTGNLIAAANIQLDHTQAFTNSGTIVADNTLAISGQSINNRGGTLQSGGAMQLSSQTDIDLTSARLKAGSLALDAQKNILLNTDAHQVSTVMQGGTRSSTQLGQTASVDVAGNTSITTGGNFEQKGAILKVGGNLTTNIGGDWQLGSVKSQESTQVNRMGGHANTDVITNLTSQVQVGEASNLNVNNDLTAQGAQFDLKGGGLLNVGGNVALTAVKDSIKVDSSSAGGGGGRSYSETKKSLDENVIGTTLQSGKDLTVQAGKDISMTGSTLQVGQGSASLLAKGNVNLQAETEQHTLDTTHIGKHSGVLSSKTTTEINHVDSKTAIGSFLSADSISIQAGSQNATKGDININGSNVVATNDVNLNAANNVNITAAQNTLDESHFKDVKTSGLMSSGGIGFTVGKRQLTTTNDGQQVTNTASTVGSIAGNVNINSGKTYTQTGSDVLAPKGDINIAAQQVNIVAAEDVNNSQQTTKFKQSGLTLAVTSSALNLAQNVAGTAQSTLNSNSNRNKMLNALQTYANGSTLKEQGTAIVDAVKAGDIKGTENAAGVRISISIGSSKSSSSSDTNATTNQGSLVKAGGNINIKATQDNIDIIGSKITADKNVTLDAAKEINLTASADTETNKSENKSSSASIGVSFGIGKNTGFSVDVAASRGKGNANSNSTTYNNTQVQASETLSLTSGNDTNLKGANASGKQVVANIGGNLNIESLQDVATSQAQQRNTSVGISIPIGPGTGGGSFSQSKQNSNSNYASVYEQSGIKAGENGFDINVKNNTDLKGAVLDSTATADKNQLTTGTLTTSNIQNHMDAKASSSTTGFGTDMLKSKYAAVKGLAGNLMNNDKESVSANSTTLSAIASANINITDNAAQLNKTGKTAEETVATLNRDTTNTNRVLAKPDMLALQDKVQQQQADNMLLVNTITAFTDESFRKMFVAQTKMYKKVVDTEGKTQWAEISDQEKQNLQPGIDGKVHIFNNGIFNPLDSAKNLAVQNNNADYLVYFPEANNFFSELLIAGYQKYLEGNTLGLANATQANVQIMNQYGQTGLQVDGHSRGGLTTGNALEVVASKNNSEGTLSNTNVNLFGSAYNAQQAANLLGFLSSGQGVLQSQVHIDDFVGTVLGGNADTGGTTPPNSNLLKEWVKIFYGESTSHNGYGEGKPNGGSEQYWQGSPNGKPASTTVAPTN